MQQLIGSYAILVESPYKLVYACVLVLIIVYSSVIPIQYKQFADSIIGRILGIACVCVTIQYLGWVYGLLTALAFLLLLHGGVAVNEGFEAVQKKTKGRKRWFVETLLGKPSTIEVDRVITHAPGDTA